MSLPKDAKVALFVGPFKKRPYYVLGAWAEMETPSVQKLREVEFAFR